MPKSKEMEEEIKLLTEEIHLLREEHDYAIDLIKNLSSELDYVLCFSSIKRNKRWSVQYRNCLDLMKVARKYAGMIK